MLHLEESEAFLIQKQTPSYYGKYIGF